MASNWISSGNAGLGFPKPGIVYDANQSIVVGTRARFRDIGTTFLSEGEFIWLPGVANTILGSWVSFSTTDGTVNTGSTTLWAGTASTSFPLAVATAAIVASSWGWYQIYGAAICAISGTIAAGNSAAWQAAGVVQAAAVATKNVEGVIALSANAVPAANQAIYFLSYPSAQTAV